MCQEKNAEKQNNQACVALAIIELGLSVSQQVTQ